MDKYHKGFTFIELLVVIGVIAITTAISLAYYNNFTDDSKLKSDINKLVDVLNLAQKKASSGDIGNATCANFDGYTVTFNPNSYVIQMKCDTCTGTSCSFTYNLQPNITLTSDYPSVTFKLLTSGIDRSSGMNVTLTSQSGKCKKLNISSVSIVNEISCP